MKFYHDDVAVVSYSGVFPGCPDEDALFDLLLKGESLIRDLTIDEERNPVQVRYHFSSDRKKTDTTYAKFGSKFSLAEIEQWAQANGLNSRSSTCIEIALHELIARMQRKVTGLFNNRKTECIVGMNNGYPDVPRIEYRQLYEKLKGQLDLSAAEETKLERFVEIISNHPSRREFLVKDAFSSLAFESVRDRFGIDGVCSFVDAACASSAASLMIAVRRLQDPAKEVDLVIAGGIDLGLDLVTLLAFGKLQILSEKIMNPFDRSADGINQGEGAGLFALMRLEDAKAAALPIHGVIRNCDGSSDGVLGGMVEPTEYGQNLAYHRAYRDVPLLPLTFLECHGTGTKLGDRIELASTAKFFHPLPPIGSVKANVGHTIAAAGAASLVKSLKIMERRVIPRMPNFKKIGRQQPHEVVSENKPIKSDETIRIGISSFGFGGSNFHFVVDEYRGEELVQSPKPSQRPFKFLLNGHSEIDLAYVSELLTTSRFKIPPVSLPYADPAVLGGILAVEALFKNLNLKLNQKQREDIGVISNSNSYLQRMAACYERLYHLEIFRRLEDEQKKVRWLATGMPNELKITEDTFMWGLNNLVAGRITKDFDLKGVNFNVASDKASLGASFRYACSMLKAHSGAYVIVAFDEDFDKGHYRLKRSKARAFLVSDLDFSLANDLPIDREILRVKSYRRQGLSVDA